MILVVDNLLGIVMTSDAVTRAGIAHERKSITFWFPKDFRIKHRNV
jgi:hypothetical protein